MTTELRANINLTDQPEKTSQETKDTTMIDQNPTKKTIQKIKKILKTKTPRKTTKTLATLSPYLPTWTI